MESLFPDQEKSCSESDDPATEDSHVMQITKEIARRYFRLRLQAYAKYYNRVILNKSKASVRNKLTKAFFSS